MRDIPEIPKPGNLEIRRQVPDEAEIFSAVENWVGEILQYTLQKDVHYEQSLYGAWNTFLGQIFSPERRFMIKPQGCLRRVVTEEEGFNDAETSISSSGGLHEARHLEGIEIDKMFPDFLIVQVHVRDIPEHKHQLICVIEIKRNDQTTQQAKSQMSKYMERTEFFKYHSETVYGFLIMGKEIQEYRFREGKLSSSDVVSLLSRNGQTALRQMAKIAIENWNIL